MFFLNPYKAESSEKILLTVGDMYTQFHPQTDNQTETEKQKPGTVPGKALQD